MLAGFEHFHDLPIADKLRLVEAMWEDIAASAEEFPGMENHRAEIERRIADYERDPAATLTRAELWRQVDDAP